MRPRASSTAAGFQVVRQFEAHRLAGDCQTQAYEQVLSETRRSALAAGPANQGNDNGVSINALTPEGVAA
jgi:hypothetical protein